MQSVNQGDTLHEMSNRISSENKNSINLISAEFTHSVLKANIDLDNRN